MPSTKLGCPQESAAKRPNLNAENVDVDEEKQAALEAAIDDGAAALEGAAGIKGSPAELLARVDKRLGMQRPSTS